MVFLSLNGANISMGYKARELQRRRLNDEPTRVDGALRRSNEPPLDTHIIIVHKTFYLSQTFMHVMSSHRSNACQSGLFLYFKTVSELGAVGNFMQVEFFRSERDERLKETL